MVVTVVRKLTPIFRSVAREMISEARDGIEVERPNPIRLGTVETSRYGEGGYLRRTGLAAGDRGRDVLFVIAYGARGTGEYTKRNEGLFDSG